MKSNQGDFIKEIRGIKGSRTTQSDRFTWESSVVKTPLVDKLPAKLEIQKATVAPKAQALDKLKNKKSDLPTTLNGNIDTGQIREDLISQLRAQKRKG